MAESKISLPSAKVAPQKRLTADDSNKRSPIGGYVFACLRLDLPKNKPKINRTLPLPTDAQRPDQEMSRQHGATQGGRHQVAVKECIISQEVLVVERVFAMVALRNVMAINGEVARGARRDSRRDGRQRSSARSCWLIVAEVLGVVVLIDVMEKNVEVI